VVGRLVQEQHITPLPDRMASTGQHQPAVLPDGKLPNWEGHLVASQSI
jgi:hypothetical protein